MSKTKNHPKKPGKKKPLRIRLHNLQKKHPISLPRLTTRVRQAAELLRIQGEWPLSLESVDLSLIEASVSSKVHREFFDDPAPTDVMTFPDDTHGEILICPAVAERQRKSEELSLHREIFTYAIHGLLHLCGWGDESETEFHAMSQKQDKVRETILAREKKKRKAATGKKSG